MDNNPLTYVLTSAKLDATGQCWVAALANYDFTIHYRSGKQNIEADALSRVKWEHDDAVVVKAVLAQGLNSDTAIPHPFTMKTIQVRNIGFVETPRLSNADWRNEQAEYIDIRPVLMLVQGGHHLQYTCKEGDLSGMHVLLKYKQDLLIKNELLYRKAKLKNND